MKVIWTEGATDDLAQHVAYIQRDSDDAGRRLASHVITKADSLISMPQRGRYRKNQDAWELFLTPWPYVIVYRIREDAVLIDGIRHTSQDTSHLSY